MNKSKLIIFAVLFFGFASESFAFSTNQNVFIRSEADLNAVEDALNSKCKCGGTPEACCKACHTMCKALNEIGFGIGRDTECGKLTVVPLHPADLR